MALLPNAGHGLLFLDVSRSHTTTHHGRWDSSERVISSSQRPLPDNTQHSQQTNIHAPGGIQTHDLSRRAATDLCLRPCGHWDRRLEFRTKNFNNININIRYNNKPVSNTTKFLGLIIENTLSWEIDQILSKLSLACCMIRSVKSVMSQDTL